MTTRDQNHLPIRVIYDSDCGFCTWCTEFLKKRTREPIHFVGFTNPDAQTQIQNNNLPVSIHNPGTIVVFTHDGRTLYRSDATLYLLKKLRFPWRALGSISIIVPRFIRDGIYNFVGNHRGFLSKWYKPKPD